MTVEPQTISLRGGLFNPPVYRAGRGDPLLVLHSAEGMGRGFTPDLDGLARHYDVIAPVLPGWDDTDGLQHLDDVHDVAFWLQDLCDALGLSRLHVAGHSLGGMFAAEFAAARPDMVERLVLAAPLGLWLDEAPVTDLFATLPKELPGLLTGDPSGPASAELFRPAANDEELEQRMYLQLANLSAAGKFIWPIPDKGLKKRLHRIAAPTLILWGERDRLASPAYGAVFQAAIARAQLVTVPGAGHLLPLERPERYVAEVTAFLG